MPRTDLSRRALLRGLGAAGALTTLGGLGSLTGCSTAPSGPGGSSGSPQAVEHQLGVTEVPSDPQRVVTVGYSDQDPVLALGVRPVAVTDWYGDHPYAVWPWAQDELGEAEPAVLNKGEFTGTPDYRYEQIAALEPDLILGLYTSMTAQQYEQLTSIAPTVGPPKGFPAFAAPWDEATRLAGRALGRSERAEQKIAEVNDVIARSRREHPEFEGRTAYVAERFEPGSSFVRAPGDPRSRLLTALGFVVSDDMPKTQGSTDGSPISDEQMNLLDADVLVWNVGSSPEVRSEIERLGVYQALPVVRDGRSVFVEDPMISGAWTWGSVLSLPTVVEALAGLIAPALN